MVKVELPRALAEHHLAPIGVHHPPPHSYFPLRFPIDLLHLVIKGHQHIVVLIHILGILGVVFAIRLKFIIIFVLYLLPIIVVVSTLTTSPLAVRLRDGAFTLLRIHAQLANLLATQSLAWMVPYSVGLRQQATRQQLFNSCCLLLYRNCLLLCDLCLLLSVKLLLCIHLLLRC